MKILIKNGQVVTENGVSREDILVYEEKIQKIGPDLTVDGKDTQIIDAETLYVLPGGIDAHTHFNIDVGIARSCDTFFTGTRSAACGGTTTIVDHMGFGPAGCSLHHQLDVYHKDAKDSVIDYGFHGVIQHINDEILEEMYEMVHTEGISSFKYYLTYGFMLQDKDAFRALRRLHEVGALTTVHPENDSTIALLKEQFAKEKKLAPIYHALSRPLQCEAEAIARTINLAEAAGHTPLYIVHLSNGLGLDYIRLAKAAGQKVWAETCPQYLLLDQRCYEREDGLKYVMSPPLRPYPELDKLWLGIDDGSIDTIATDHCSFTYMLQKQAGKYDFRACPNGAPGVETRMPLIFSEGVIKGRISINRFADLMSTNPAKLFGMYPQKGCLAVGSDADIVLLDPNRKVEIQHNILHDNTDYTPFEGFVVTGWPVLTMSRGMIVAKDGQFTGVAGHGRFVRRKPFSV